MSSKAELYLASEAAFKDLDAARRKVGIAQRRLEEAVEEVENKRLVYRAAAQAAGLFNPVLDSVR